MYNELYRPQYHFTPAKGWMNDPNGLVFYDGEYHLFYQHDPTTIEWGTMHWGHAVSTDLVHWAHLPVALFPDQIGQIWSGSAVVDAENTSGLVPGGGLVALFSYQNQSQGAAFSTDRGRTWQMYENNPILPALGRDFRDPKVLWHETTQQWVMVIAAQRVIKFFTSDNLLDWELASEFEDWRFFGGVWEVPDLFPLTINGEEKWILIVSINPGGSAGGSGTRYYIGDFDGQTFTDNYPREITWLDYGPDNYAGTTWNNTPEDERLFVGWMSNWVYASMTPTTPWRGAATTIREFSLKQTAAGLRLVQLPVAALTQQREPLGVWTDQTIDGEISFESLSGQQLEIIAEFELGTALRFGIELFKSGADSARVLYNSETSQLYTVRPTKGITSMPVAGADLLPEDNRIRVHILVDSSSLEVFGNDGLVAITSQVFPEPDSTGVVLFTEGGNVQLVRLEAYRLASIWTNR